VACARTVRGRVGPVAPPVSRDRRLDWVLAPGAPAEAVRKPGGITVTTGSRIAAKAGPSEVLISQTVRDLIPGSGLVFEDAGEHDLKGVPGRRTLYRVVAE
jgi:hypothetical protein